MKNNDRLRKIAALSRTVSAIREDFRIAMWGELGDELAPLLKLLDKAADGLHAIGGKLAAPKDESLPLFEADRPAKAKASPDGWERTPIDAAILGTKLRKTLADLGVKDAGQAWAFILEPASRKALSKEEVDATRKYCLDLEFGPDEEPPAAVAEELPPLPSWRTTPSEALDLDPTTIDYMLEAEVITAGEAWDLIERGELVDKLAFSGPEAREIHHALVKLRAEAGDPAEFTGVIEERPEEDDDEDESPYPLRTNPEEFGCTAKDLAAIELSTSSLNSGYGNSKLRSIIRVGEKTYAGTGGSYQNHCLKDITLVEVVPRSKWTGKCSEKIDLNPVHGWRGLIAAHQGTEYVLGGRESEVEVIMPPGIRYEDYKPKRFIDVANLPKSKREKKAKPISPLPASEVLAGSTTVDPYPPGTLMFACNRCNARRSSVDCKPPHPCPACKSPEFRSYFVPQPGGLRTYEVVSKLDQKESGHIQFGAVDDVDAARKVALDWPKLTFREITDPSRMVGNQVGSLGQPKSPQPWQEAPKPLKAWEVRDFTGAVLGHVESTSLGGARNKANKRWARRPDSDKSLKVSEAASLAY